MTKIIAFGASNSRQSINRQLARWAARQMDNAAVEIPDLNDFEMPIYGIDREKGSGIPEKAKAFKGLIRSADGLIISLAEHNGSYTTAFKNIVDWVSRIEPAIWSDKPMLLMASSPGGRGGMNVLNTAKATFPYQGAKVAGTFSLPSFGQNFSPSEGIMEPELKKAFFMQLENFKQAIHEAQTEATTTGP